MTTELPVVMAVYRDGEPWAYPVVHPVRLSKGDSHRIQLPLIGSRGGPFGIVWVQLELDEQITGGWWGARAQLLMADSTWLTRQHPCLLFTEPSGVPTVVNFLPETPGARAVLSLSLRSDGRHLPVPEAETS